MATYSLEIVTDHLLIRRDGRLGIVDTGSPVTIASPPGAAEALGLPATEIVGTDFLGERPVLIDWPGRRLVTDVPIPNGPSIRLRSLLGVPTLEIGTPLGRRRAILDTGAWLSYAAPEAVHDRPPVPDASVRDFLPGYGAFETDCYRVPFTLRGELFEWRFGVLPAPLRGMLKLLGCDGWIVGAELFRERRWLLDLAGERLFDVTHSAAYVDRAPGSTAARASRRAGAPEADGSKCASAQPRSR